MSETRDWANEVGLDVRGKPDWIVGFALETHGNLPARQNSGYTTRSELFVSRSVWSVDVWKRGRNFSYVIRPGFKKDRAYESGHKTLKLRPPKNLATIGRWLEMIEKTLDAKFRRDRPTIHSNVKGGAKAIFSWLQEL